MSKSLISEASLTGWRDWGLDQQPSLIKNFTEGKSHQTALIESAGKKYVVKKFNHSADTAINAQKSAAQYSIAPNILYNDERIVLMEYLNGTLPNLERTAKALLTLHQEITTHQTKPLNVIDACEGYLSSAPEALRAQHKSLLPILKEFINDPTALCFCHNDLINENCLSHNQAAMFIDWEYAAPHNPWFDLAAIIIYRQLDIPHAQAFLSAYQINWQHKVNERIFLSSQIALLWSDLLWHVDKYGSDYQVTHQSRFKQLELLCDALRER